MVALTSNFLTLQGLKLELEITLLTQSGGHKTKYLQISTLLDFSFESSASGWADLLCSSKAASQ